MSAQPGTLYRPLADAKARLRELKNLVRSGQRDDNATTRANVAALEAEVAELEAQAAPPAVSAVTAKFAWDAKAKPKKRSKRHG